MRSDPLSYFSTLCLFFVIEHMQFLVSTLHLCLLVLDSSFAGERTVCFHLNYAPHYVVHLYKVIPQSPMLRWILVNILVNILCTLSILMMSLLYQGNQNCTQYSKTSLANILSNYNTASHLLWWTLGSQTPLLPCLLVIPLCLYYVLLCPTVPLYSPIVHMKILSWFDFPKCSASHLSELKAICRPLAQLIKIPL